MLQMERNPGQGRKGKRCKSQAQGVKEQGRTTAQETISRKMGLCEHKSEAFQQSRTPKAVEEKAKWRTAAHHPDLPGSSH